MLGPQSGSTVNNALVIGVTGASSLLCYASSLCASVAHIPYDKYTQFAPPPGVASMQELFIYFDHHSYPHYDHRVLSPHHMWYWWSPNHEMLARDSCFVGCPRSRI